MKTTIKFSPYNADNSRTILTFPGVGASGMENNLEKKERLIIRGGRRLTGEVVVSGSKNASLGVIAASLLTGEDVVIRRAPSLRDVHTIMKALSHMGSRLSLEDGALHIDNSDIRAFEAPLELMNQMRASIYVMGPLLARFGHARAALPGGCMIGSRPIDYHLNGFAQMGAEIEIGGGFVEARCGRLTGARIHMDFPSVGATINLMMAATLAEGETALENAAEEPHVVDVARFLQAMGAKVSGAGTKTIVVEGVEKLHGAEHTMIPDQIEAGTFMAAVAATRGRALVRDVCLNDMQAVTAKMIEAGVRVEERPDGLLVEAPVRVKPVRLSTLPHPGFPTDMQPQMMALLSLADGVSVVKETVWENRFMHVAELGRMGADIKVEGNAAIVAGREGLTGALVESTDLRAGAALVIAGLAAQGESSVFNVEYIDRGYEKLEEKISALGGDIVRVRPVADIKAEGLRAVRLQAS